MTFNYFFIFIPFFIVVVFINIFFSTILASIASRRLFAVKLSLVLTGTGPIGNGNVRALKIIFKCLKCGGRIKAVVRF